MLVKNTYQAGNTIRLKATFKDYDGNNVDPSIIKLTMYNYKYETIGVFPAIRSDIGSYYCDYITPKIEERYVYEWYGEIDGTPSLRRDSFIVKMLK